MTLVLGVVRPGDGAWVCADHQVTAGRRMIDSDSRKLLAVQCANGPVLLACAGLAHMTYSGVSFTDWARETIRGSSRNIGDTIRHLASRMDRDMPRRWRREPLTVAAIAFAPTASGDPGAWVTQISNSQVVDGTVTTEPEFAMVTSDRLTEPTLLGFGSGWTHVPQRRRRRLLEIVQNRPRRRTDYLGLLASEMRRVSSTMRHLSPPDTSVSAWSEGCYVSASGVGRFDFKLFRERGDEPPSDPWRASQLVLAGVDISALVPDSVRLELQHQRGQVSTEKAVDLATETLRRATTPRD